MPAHYILYSFQTNPQLYFCQFFITKLLYKTCEICDFIILYRSDFIKHMNYQDILDFWFDAAHRPQWFAKSDDFDRLIAERFQATHTAASQAELWSWRSSAEGRLAESGCRRSTCGLPKRRGRRPLRGLAERGRCRPGRRLTKGRRCRALRGLTERGRCTCRLPER